VAITLDWLGCATFRLTIDHLVVYLDAYMDRVSSAPPVGLSTAEVGRADFVLVGHSHFDHLAGAEVIACNTGARIIGSNESCRVMTECGVPNEQLLPSQGGERHRLSDTVTVRVFPSVHSCLWAGAPSIDEMCSGDLGLCEDDRRSLLRERNPFRGVEPSILDHMRNATGSPRDGGALVYVIETPYGSIFYQDTSGCWGSLLQNASADVAILAVAARPNHDGEPYQGSMAQFLAMEASLLQPKTVVLGHHDNWLGRADFVPVDTSPVRRELSKTAPKTELLEMGYLEGVPIL
jgi:L-ascorbate metabolism protein UlaG (beta-lactamase superfamily)